MATESLLLVVPCKSTQVVTTASQTVSESSHCVYRLDTKADATSNGPDDSTDKQSWSLIFVHAQKGRDCTYVVREPPYELWSGAPILRASLSINNLATVFISKLVDSQPNAAVYDRGEHLASAFLRAADQRPEFSVPFAAPAPAHKLHEPISPCPPE